MVIKIIVKDFVKIANNLVDNQIIEAGIRVIGADNPPTNFKDQINLVRQLIESDIRVIVEDNPATNFKDQIKLFSQVIEEFNPVTNFKDPIVRVLLIIVRNCYFIDSLISRIL